MNQLTQMQSLSDAIGILNKARKSSTDVTPIWLKLKNSTEYLEKQVSHLLKEDN